MPFDTLQAAHPSCAATVARFLHFAPSVLVSSAHFRLTWLALAALYSK